MKIINCQRAANLIDKRGKLQGAYASLNDDDCSITLPNATVLELHDAAARTALSEAVALAVAEIDAELAVLGVVIG